VASRQDWLPRGPGLAGVKRPGLAGELLAGGAAVHHTSWVELWDTEMPAELVRLCRPLHCQLCNSQATSPGQARMHYQGKQHDKQVRAWFSRWEGNPDRVLPQRLHPPEKVARTGGGLGAGAGAGASPHCPVCDLHFTSATQLDQHMAGRPHQRRAAALPALKPGYFNRQIGRWQREPPESAAGPAGSGAGEAGGETGEDDGEVGGRTGLCCRLCGVAAPSKAQLDIHLAGKSHKARVRRGGSGTSGAPAPAPPPGPTAFSAHRTPSGQFYCAACNLTLNSELQFSQHQASKKHKQKEAIHNKRGRS